jgi:hypothetical protein
MEWKSREFLDPKFCVTVTVQFMLEQAVSFVE